MAVSCSRSRLTLVLCGIQSVESDLRRVVYVSFEVTASLYIVVVVFLVFFLSIGSLADRSHGP